MFILLEVNQTGRNKHIQYIDPTGNFWFIPLIIAIAKGALIGAAIGAAVAAATGGSFGYGAAQGAKTSAIAYAANEAMHEVGELAQKALNSNQHAGPTKDINIKSNTNNSSENAKSNQSDDTKSKGINCNKGDGSVFRFSC